jgi:hypothetical protein
MSSALQTVLRVLEEYTEFGSKRCCAKEKECYHRLPHPRFSFLVSVVYSSYFRHFSSLDSVMYSDMYTHCHLYTSDVTVTMARSTCRRPGAGRNSELGPPSSQSTSEAQLHVSAQMGGGGGKRGPQSAQSVP